MSTSPPPIFLPLISTSAHATYNFSVNIHCVIVPFHLRVIIICQKKISIITECFSSRELSFMPWLGSLNLLKLFATIYNLYITTKDVSTISYHSLNRQNIQNKSTKKLYIVHHFNLQIFRM